MSVQLFHGDCLKIMPTLPQVDAIITDLPYGTTKNKWDAVIPFEPMWEQVKRVLKPGGRFITSSRQPFTSALVLSNPFWFRYEIIWDKKAGTDFAQANRKPVTVHENILVFGVGSGTYNRIDDKGKEPYSDKRTAMRVSNLGASNLEARIPFTNRTTRVPTTIRTYFPDNRKGLGSSLHPTQKPLALYEWLVCSYTNLGETVLDICFGSGTTGVAAVKAGRSFIGVEKELGYYVIGQKRIAEAQAQV